MSNITNRTKNLDISNTVIKKKRGKEKDRIKVIIPRLVGKSINAF